ncbi:transcriptional regulator domain-containing protein [Methylosinus sp. Sm6]|uniref:transcriptional regulator domain-containing protein n=1 Tax=Methylosinus sp. Sm6 TaxID=2866948 RepID=UPI001C99D1AC|nr:DUF6499 domain-containing protein [Methylosinus sp. Sm6]MBY6239573.1 DUF6499 domain-containing protein [Methylosinus sp. Sm6]
MRPDISRWRSASAYDYLDRLVAPDLAWEWLRRNGDYQRDYSEIGRHETEASLLTDRTRQRWGLQFRCSSVLQRYRNDDLLGARSRSWPRHSDRSASAG